MMLNLNLGKIVMGGKKKCTDELKKLRHIPSVCTKIYGWRVSDDTGCPDLIIFETTLFL